VPLGVGADGGGFQGRRGRERGPNANDVFLSSLTFGRLVKEVLSVCSYLKACVQGYGDFPDLPLPFSIFYQVDSGTGSIKETQTRLIAIKVVAGKQR